MKLVPTSEECANIILGTYAGASFYNTFDKILYDQNYTFIKMPIDSLTIENINEILTKIQSHWNKQNCHDFTIYSTNNMKFINELVEKPKENYKKFIITLDFKGIQNTKISKMLHVLNPNVFPMLDPNQGKYLIRNYKNNSKEHLIKAFESFSEYHINNLQKTKKIENILVKSYGINISCVRISELLLWIQTQLSKKEMTKVIIKTDI